MICAIIDLLCSVNENSSILTRLIIFGQDFYSHSNWVELGHRHIHPHLLKPGREIKSIAEGNEWAVGVFPDISAVSFSFQALKAVYGSWVSKLLLVILDFKKTKTNSGLKREEK